ncbi:hypothetical protein PG984_005346 [Apiospora sp. TS-2023a]
MMLDEAHQVRNPDTRIYKAISSTRYKYFMALTASPVVNQAEDFHNIIKLIDKRNWNTLAKADKKESKGNIYEDFTLEARSAEGRGKHFRESKLYKAILNPLVGPATSLDEDEKKRNTISLKSLLPATNTAFVNLRHIPDEVAAFEQCYLDSIKIYTKTAEETANGGNSFGKILQSQRHLDRLSFSPMLHHFAVYCERRKEDTTVHWINVWRRANWNLTDFIMRFREPTAAPIRTAKGWLELLLRSSPKTREILHTIRTTLMPSLLAGKAPTKILILEEEPLVAFLSVIIKPMTGVETAAAGSTSDQSFGPHGSQTENMKVQPQPDAAVPEAAGGDTAYRGPPLGGASLDVKIETEREQDEEHHGIHPGPEPEKKTSKRIIQKLSYEDMKRIKDSYTFESDEHVSACPNAEHTECEEGLFPPTNADIIPLDYIEIMQTMNPALHPMIQEMLELLKLWDERPRYKHKGPKGQEAQVLECTFLHLELLRMVAAGWKNEDGAGATANEILSEEYPFLVDWELSYFDDWDGFLALPTHVSCSQPIWARGWGSGAPKEARRRELRLALKVQLMSPQSRTCLPPVDGALEEPARKKARIATTPSVTGFDGGSTSAVAKLMNRCHGEVVGVHNSEIGKILDDMDATKITKLWRSDMSTDEKQEWTELIRKLDHDLAAFKLQPPDNSPPSTSKKERPMPKVLWIDDLKYTRKRGRMDTGTLDPDTKIRRTEANKAERINIARKVPEEKLTKEPIKMRICDILQILAIPEDYHCEEYHLPTLAICDYGVHLSFRVRKNIKMPMWTMISPRIESATMQPSIAKETERMLDLADAQLNEKPLEAARHGVFDEEAEVDEEGLEAATLEGVDDGEETDGEVPKCSTLAGV